MPRLCAASGPRSVRYVQPKIQECRGTSPVQLAVFRVALGRSGAGTTRMAGSPQVRAPTRISAFSRSRHSLGTTAASARSRRQPECAGSKLHLDCLLSPHNQDMGLRNSRSSRAAKGVSAANFTVKTRFLSRLAKHVREFIGRKNGISKRSNSLDRQRRAAPTR